MDQFRKLMDFIKGMISRKEKKKLIENSVIVIIIGVIIIVAGGTFFNSSAKKSVEPENRSDSGESAETFSKTDSKSEGISEVESRIEKVLSKIDGAGKVTVMVTYASGKEIVPATDVKKTENGTVEKDSGGGTRDIDQNEYESKVVYEEIQGGGKKPVVLKEMLPDVKGVLVVAEGAADILVRDSLTRAVQVLMDIPIHKIQVFKSVK